MAVTVYRSTDASAPTLSGTAGDLVNVLDKCLVAGYGSKAAAGWTKPFVATNQATFKPGSGVQHFFHIDDNAPNATALGAEAQVRGSETATAVLTGTGFFPTTAQIAAGAGTAIRKSNGVSATTRTWIVIADDRTCYVFVLTTDVASTYFSAAFGEFYSLLASTDLFRSLVIGRTANSATAAGDFLPAIVVGISTGNQAQHYIPRLYTGLGTAIQFQKWGDSARANTAATVGLGSLPVPEPVSGGLHVAPIHITDQNATTVRARMRGYFHLCHTPTAFTDGDTITGSGAYAGRTFLLLKSSGGAAGAGVHCLDITGAWETN